MDNCVNILRKNEEIELHFSTLDFDILQEQIISAVYIKLSQRM